MQQFGDSATYEPVRSFADVFAAVETSRQDFGVVPVENSTAGSVGETLDNFAQTSLTVCAEILYQIHFALLSKETDLKSIKRVYSLPIAAEQCRRWLAAHLPDARVVDASGDASSTARAAQLAAEDPGSAAIAGRIAAEIYGLNILQERIEDSAHNRTRFFVLGHHGGEPSGRDKTSIMFAVAHRPGALSSVLECLEQNQLNMTMINSRPTKLMPWEYVFFVDVQGHAAEEPLSSALKVMSGRCAFLRVLGSYPDSSRTD
ncbi:MAG: prephenate dehydratase [Chloroflexi bacterium]|nr:prephenate dehydratase [Chloroflexota bacterium]